MDGLFELRKTFLKKSEHFLSMGVLENQDDIFFLTMAEIFRLSQGENLTENPRNLIEKRKKEFSSNVDQPIPDMLLGHDGFSFESNQDSLKGIGVSAGKAQGVARFLRGLSDIEGVTEGDVLIVDQPCVSDLPLFLLSKAVIGERGGFLSDAACLLRDLGIPAVFHVPEASKKIRAGEDLRVNASLGTISVGKKEEPFYNT